MKLITNIAICLALSSGLAEAADLKVRSNFGIQILTPGENCKLDDASSIKLLFLNCIANREAKNGPQRNLDCLDPKIAIGGLNLSHGSDLSLPAPIRNARLKLHALYEQEVAANPNPESQLETLQIELRKFESCKARVLFALPENIKEGELEKNSYETDLADALGLSFNGRTTELLENFSNQKILSQEYSSSYSQISLHVDRMRSREGRLVPTLSQWIDYAHAYAFGGHGTPLSSLFHYPIENMFQAYGVPAMTEKVYNGCETINGNRFHITWKATTLWNKSLSSLVPPEERQAMILSPLHLDAATLNYSFFKDGIGPWSARAYIGPGKKCPSKPIKQDLF